MGPIEEMAKSGMLNMDGRSKKNRTQDWRKIKLSYLQSHYKSMLRRRRAFEKVKEQD